MLNATCRFLMVLVAVVGMTLVIGCANQGGPAASQAKPLYHHINADGDDGIEMEEYKAYWVSRFDRADTDDDGKMTVEEFVVNMNAERRSRDVNGDGICDRDEMLTTLVGADSETLGEITPNTHKGLASFKAMDANGDGKVAQIEYAAEVCRWHAHGDNDADGDRTDAERDKRLKFLHAQMDANDDGVVEEQEMVDVFINQ